ncbi:hypothetical protein OAU36_04230 [Gammaproteobacteria bacterium]|nr:hypothetical protein [Gammaproteobacteria bacterium]
MELARQYSDVDIQAKLDQFAAQELRLVTEPDSEFRFHSGPPS